MQYLIENHAVLWMWPVIFVAFAFNKIQAVFIAISFIVVLISVDLLLGNLGEVQSTQRWVAIQDAKYCHLDVIAEKVNKYKCGNNISIEFSGDYPTFKQLSLLEANMNSAKSSQAAALGSK